jgi:phosphoribosylformylglycinamidine cyclo-ligase
VRILPAFNLIAEVGNIPERDMFNTFNMGVGMSVIVPAEQESLALKILNDCGEDAYVIGSIVRGEEKVVLK